MLKVWIKSTALFSLSICVLCACSERNFREEFFKNRRCAEVQYQCLPESQEKKMLDLSQPYRLTDEEEARIEQDNTLRMHHNIIKMLEIYYPGFWQDTDEQTQLAWVGKVDEITKRYYPNRQDYHLERMASICAIIGLDFEKKTNLAFIVQKIRSSSTYVPLVDINDYLRFEVLQKIMMREETNIIIGVCVELEMVCHQLLAIYQILIRNGNLTIQKRIENASIENG